MSRQLAITFCVAGMATAVVPLAEAHTSRTASQHQMGFAPDESSDVFTGTVSSSAGACERGRSVTLFRKVGDVSVPDLAVETAATNSDGVWSQGFSDAPEGRYYAVAARKVVRRSGHRHICDAAKSNTVTVENPPNPVDFCRLQFPLAMTLEAGAMSDQIYGRVYEPGLTDQSPSENHPSIESAVGYGPDGTDPATNPNWSFFPAAANPGYDGAISGEPNNDEHVGSFTAPAIPGAYDYAFRFTRDGGDSFIYCDAGAEGSANGYSSANAGQMTVVP